MEKSKLSAKWIAVIAAGAVAVVTAVVLLIVHFTGTEDSYRSIQIYELDGTATIEREELGKIDAVKNLYLESGDRISVSKDSCMRLKLDDDKYILVEENSILSIVADGNDEDSRTSIKLEQGAIVNEIQNKLSDDSDYEVNTPNSVMAVRGTIFRVDVIMEENGEIYTKVTVFEGKVETWQLLLDGTRADESVIVEAGCELTIHTDNDKTEYLSEPQAIDYGKLSLECLEYLQELMESGTKISGISREELKTLIKRLKRAEDTVAASEKPSASEAAAEESDVPAVSATAPMPSEKTAGNSSGHTGGSAKEKTYTVTFVYGGRVFGTQTVREGQQADVPKLAPSSVGAWDYDFSQVVTEDITIEWK